MSRSSSLSPVWQAGVVFVGLCITFWGALPNCHGFFTTVQNDFYGINVVDDTTTSPPDSIGGFQLHTGLLHPAGANMDITFGSSGNVNIGTSFSGIRVRGNSYTSDAHGGGTTNPVTNLDQFFLSQEPTPGYVGSGWRTSWDLVPQRMTIVQDVIAVGDQFDQSAIYHTVSVTNRSSSPVEVEWLNLMDFDTATSSRLSNTVERSDGTVLVENSHEYSHAPTLPDELVRISDFSGLGTYDAFWSLSYDPGILPVLEGEPLDVTTPDEFQFVAWSAAFNPANFSLPFNVFNYVVDPTLEVASSIDSAGIAKFGAVIPGNGSVRFTQVFWARPIPEPSTGVLLLCFAVVVVLARGGFCLFITN